MKEAEWRYSCQKKESKFEHYGYSSQSELENFIAGTSKEVFGEDSVFLDLKKSLGHGKGQLSYPDGYVIDLSDIENPTLFIIEVERSAHHVYKHIFPQITQHLNFFEKNKEKVKTDLEHAIQNDIDTKRFIENKIKTSSYASMPDLVYDLVFKKPRSLVIVIDKISSDLEEVVEKNISKFSDTKVVQFETYVKIENNKKEFIHKFRPLNEETGELKEELGTWYRIDLDALQFVEESRAVFDKKHNIPKYAQGFVYSKNKDNQIDGVVILWYRSNVDRHFLKEKLPYAATGKPFNVDKLKAGMDVFIVELQYDRNTGKRIVDPKVRVRGKLKEIYRIDGEVETKIFPA